MKVSITIARRPDGTFKYLYVGEDAAQAVAIAEASDDPEVEVYRKPLAFRRYKNPVKAPAPAPAKKKRASRGKA